MGRILWCARIKRIESDGVGERLVYFIHRKPSHWNMPTGLKQTSSPIAVSFSLTESAANTFTQERIDLQLNPLDNEVFVVTGVNLDPTVPTAVLNTNTEVRCSLTRTSQTDAVNLSTASALATAVLNIQCEAAPGTGTASFTRSSQDTPTHGVEYIGIIATNDFFVQIRGTQNTSAKFVSGRMWGYRAKASSSIYAALVQSEVLSS